MTEQEEYEKFNVPEEYEKKIKMKKLRSEKIKNTNLRLKKKIELENTFNRRKQLSDNYGI